jgi:hypothetical protein
MHRSNDSSGFCDATRSGFDDDACGHDGADGDSVSGSDDELVCDAFVYGACDVLSMG